MTRPESVILGAAGFARDRRGATHAHGEIAATGAPGTFGETRPLEHDARWSLMTAVKVARWCAWFAFPSAGMLWVATRYGDSGWYHSDEWAIIGRTTESNGSLSNAFAGFNGHLEIGSYAVYRLQRSWFGLEAHQLVYVAFCASLAALQLSVAAVLRRLGLPTLIALLAATVVTFFGPGAQNMVWEFQLSLNFALALCFTAGFVALRDDTTPRAAVAIAGLLVLAVGLDSGLAAFGAVFVGVVVVLLWPRRLMVLALGPPLAAHVAWFAFGDTGTYLPTSLGNMASFVFHLFTLSAGGLVGGGETHAAIARSVGAPQAPSPTIPLSGETVGVIVLVIASACVALGFARHRLSRKVVASFIGGLVAAVVAVAVITRTRAFIVDPAFQLAGSRYVQWVALFLLLAFAPAIAATLRPASPRSGRGVGIAGVAALTAVFMVNLGQVWPVREFDEAWGANVESRVRRAVTVLTEGCGEGSRPDLRANVAQFDTEVTVHLLQDLLARGDLTPGFGVPASREVRKAVCRPAVPPDRPSTGSRANIPGRPR